MVISQVRSHKSTVTVQCLLKLSTFPCEIISYYLKLCVSKQCLKILQNSVSVRLSAFVNQKLIWVGEMCEGVQKDDFQEQTDKHEGKKL